MKHQLVLRSVVVVLVSTGIAVGQSLLDGTTFEASIYNLPDTIGVVRLVDTSDSDCRTDGGPAGNDVASPEECIMVDSGIPPVTMTFNAGPQAIGGLMVTPTVAPFAGLDPNDPIVIFNAANSLSAELSTWSSDGELFEFTLRTQDDSYPASNEEDFWGFSATGIQYPGAAPDSEVGMPYDEPLDSQTNFYFWFEDKDGPMPEYDIFLDTGIGVGPHPIDDRDVVYITYSRGQVDEQTDTPPGGSLEFHSHGSILHELPQIGNLFVLADGVGVDPFSITGIGFGFLVEPPEIAVSGLPGDFDGDNALTAADIDLLSAQVGQGDLSFDLNADGAVTDDDRLFWVQDLAGTLLGDADLDKTVAFSDFLALSAAYNLAGGWATGDFDGSGDVGFPDFLLLSNNYNMSAGPAAVPEPEAWTGFLSAGLILLVVRRRR